MVVYLHGHPGPDPDPGLDLDVDQGIGPVVGLPTAVDGQGLEKVDEDAPDPERDVAAPDPEIGIVDPGQGKVVARDQNPGKDTEDQGPNLGIGTGKVGKKRKILARMKM